MKVVLSLLLLLSGCALAQTPERTRFSLFANIVDLPESGSSQPAMIEGEILQLTGKWGIRNENLFADNAQGYFFGVQYQLDIKKLMDHTLWSHQDFEFYLTGSLGKVYSQRNFVDRSGVGGMFGGGLNYLPRHSERLEVDIFELRLARLPNVHGGLAAVVSTGIQLGF